MAGAVAGRVAQWFYQRRGEWEPFGGVENAELEDAWRGGRESVEFGAGRFRAVLPTRTQHNHDAGTRREILRGTWFVQRSDGHLHPCAEDVGAVNGLLH